MLGSPPPRPNRAYTGDLAALHGSYRGPGRGRELTVTVSRDTSGLTLRLGNSRSRRLEWIDGLTFAERDGVALYHFVQRRRGRAGTPG